MGSFAVQLAKAAGARVLATAGTDNQQTLKALGTDAAIDYTQDGVTETALDDTAGAGVDAVFDTVGGDIVVNSIPTTRTYGRIATILGGQGDFVPLYQKNQVLYGVLPARESEAR